MDKDFKFKYYEVIKYKNYDTCYSPKKCCKSKNNTVNFTLETCLPGLCDTNYGQQYLNVENTCDNDYIVSTDAIVCNPTIKITTGTGDIFYALANDNRLISFNDPQCLKYKSICGLDCGQTALAIDFRPATGQLILLTNSPGGAQLFVLDLCDPCKVIAKPLNGFLRTQAGTTIIFEGNVSIDFNPVVDRLRIVTTSGQNFRVNVDTGITIVDGTLKYANGNVGSTPRIVSIAYSNNVAGATTTTLYGIDANLNALVTINPPNAGVVNVVGVLGVNASQVQGFDIQAGTNIALAILTVNGTTGLYNINLLTGAATLIKTFKCSCVPIKDFAIAPIPKPTTVQVLLLKNDVATCISGNATVTIDNPVLELNKSTNNFCIPNNYYDDNKSNVCETNIQCCDLTVCRCDRLSAVISSSNSTLPAQTKFKLSFDLQKCKYNNKY